MNLSAQRDVYIFSMTLWVMLISSFCVDAQSVMYTSTTEDDVSSQKISRRTEGAYDIVEIWEDDKYSAHYFTKTGATKEWIHRDKTNGHDFVATRNGNNITIIGLHKHKNINKTVAVDEHIWTNKIDYGLSYFVRSGNDETIFWTLKLGDLEPLQFKAYREDKEDINISGQPIETIKIKITLKNIFLAKLWSARLWYRASDDLFLKYEGPMGKPGTPITTIEIAEDI